MSLSVRGDYYKWIQCLVQFLEKLYISITRGSIGKCESAKYKTQFCQVQKDRFFSFGRIYPKQVQPLLLLSAVPENSWPTSLLFIKDDVQSELSDFSEKLSSRSREGTEGAMPPPQLKTTFWHHCRLIFVFSKHISLTSLSIFFFGV